MSRFLNRLLSWGEGRGKARASGSVRRNRNRFRPTAEALEDRLAPATFVWIGPNNGNFSTAANWSNAASGAAGTPGAGDSLVFPLSGTVTPGTVNNDLPAGTAFASITFLSDGWTIAGNTLGVTTGINDTTNTAGTNTISANLSFAAATHSVGINVVNPASGATANQLAIGGTVNLGSPGVTTSGVGSLSFNNTVSGAGGLVADGSGTVSLTAADSYGGGTTVNGGIVAVSGNATALGTGAVTVNSGGTLQLGVSNVSNALNLNGFGFNGNGALTFGASGLTYVGPITLQTNTSINVGGNNETLSGPGAGSGSISGPSGLTLVGTNAGRLIDQDAGTYTGVTNVLGPTLELDSPAAGQTGGQNTGTSGYVVSQGGVLTLDNSTGGLQVNNRLGTSASVELDGGSLTFTGTAATSESFAALNLGNAAPGITGSNTVDLGANNNTVAVTTLNRNPGSTVTFLGSNMGSTNTITFGAFGTGAGLVNGILPYADVANGAGPATDFATHNLNGNTGIGIAASTSFTAFGTAGGNGTENIKGDNPGGTLSLTGDIFVNSINLNGENINANGHTITIASGGVLESSGTSAIIMGGTIQFSTAANGTGPVEGIITVSDVGGLFLSTTPIAVGTNLTLNLSPTGSAGDLIFAGTPAASSYTGVTWVTSGAVFLSTAATATVIPGLLVIGDNAGGTNADEVRVSSNFQQLGGDVVVNSSGELFLPGGISQSVGKLTLQSGLASATADVLGTLTVTGRVNAGGVGLSPATGLTGNLPDVSDFQPSLITGSGSLILAPGGVAAGTATFDVLRTPAVFDGGEEDLQLSAVIGAGSATLDKTGGGTLAIFTLPSAGYTGTVQIDGGRFAVAVANFNRPVVVNTGGVLGNDSVAGGSTANSVTADGGVVTPSLGEFPLAEVFTNSGPDNLSAGGVVAVHIGGYGGPGVDSDQLVGSTGANQVTLGGTSVLMLDLFGLAENGSLTGANSPFRWANPLIGRFSDAPNATGNILPAADVLNNPTGFQAVVSYGAGFLTVTLTHPPAVPNSTYTAAQNTPLTVGTKAAGVLAGLTDPDFNGTVAQATQDTVANPGTYTGTAGGTLTVNANGTFTYVPAAGFSGTESFTLTAVNPLGGTSAPFTVSFAVSPSAVSVTPVVSVAIDRHGRQVLEVVGTTGTLTQIDATGAHVLGGGFRSASVAFDRHGQEVLVAVELNGTLLQFDSRGAHVLGGGIASALVAFDRQGREVLVAVELNGMLVQSDATGAHVLGGGILSAGVAFDPRGREVLALVTQGGTLILIDRTGAHVLGGGIASAGVAFAGSREVLLLLTPGGTLFQIGPVEAASLGGGYLAAAEAFGPAGEVLDAIFQGDALFQFQQGMVLPLGTVP